jgi:hypothetical protein
VETPHRDRHPSDNYRDRIAPAEYPAVRNRDPRAGIETERAQARTVFGGQAAPVHRDDARALAAFESL